MKIAMNSKCPETDGQRSDYEYWDELQKSGYRNISSREFAHRPSTRIDPEILQSINRVSIRPGQKRNSGTHMIIDSSVPNIRAKLRRWNRANPQDRDSLGNTALHQAVIKGEPPVVIEFLVNKGIDVNALNNAQQTALFLATHTGRANLVKALLKMGACPKLRNSKGISPIKATSIKGHISGNELMGSGAKAKVRKGKKR